MLLYNLVACLSIPEPSHLPSFVFSPLPSLRTAPSNTIEYTLEKCKLLAEKVASTNDLPYECKKYPEAVQTASKIKRRATEKGAFEGMQGGLAAQANKKKGIDSHAQIQRRLTNSRRFTKQN